MVRTIDVTSNKAIDFCNLKPIIKPEHNKFENLFTFEYSLNQQIFFSKYNFPKLTNLGY